MAFFTILSLITGCDPKEPDDTSTSPEDTSTDTDTDTDDTSIAENLCEPLDDVEGHRFEGRVEYADGTIAKGNVRVQMCASSCYVAAWGDDGGFCFRKGILSPGTYSFDTVPTTGDPNTYATPLTFIHIEEDDSLIQLTEPIIIPTFSANQSASDGTFDAGGGLTINVNTANFSEETVHAVPMDTATAGLPLTEFENKTIIGMWYLGPFNESTGEPWSFTLESSSIDALAGEQIQIYNASYHDYAWLETGTATINADGQLVSDTDSGISYLSILLLVQ